MSFPMQKLFKNIQLYSKNVLAAREVAESLLYDLATFGEDIDLAEIRSALLPEILVSLRELLERIVKQGLYWEPFLIGGKERLDSPSFQNLIHRLQQDLSDKAVAR